MIQPQKKQSMKREQFLAAAVDMAIKTADDKTVKSLQKLIDRLEAQYKDDTKLKLPCRDTMYKYLSGCISEFERESDVSGLNPFEIFKRYSISANALNGLLSISPFKYRTVSEDANGLCIGLLSVIPKKEREAGEYLHVHFNGLIASLLIGIGAIVIFFESANKEAEFYNLLTPHNTDIDILYKLDE